MDNIIFDDGSSVCATRTVKMEREWLERLGSALEMLPYLNRQEHAVAIDGDTKHFSTKQLIAASDPLMF